MKLRSPSTLVSIATLLFAVAPWMCQALPKPDYPVILIHGISGSAEESWGDFKSFLEGQGWQFGGSPTYSAASKQVSPVSAGDFYTMNMSDYDRLLFKSQHLTLSEQGWEVAAVIKQVLSANPEKNRIMLVGHSMGGLASRSYLQGLAKKDGVGVPYRRDVAKLITVDTPHQGAELATFCQQFTPFGLPFCEILTLLNIDPGSVAVDELRADSPALLALNNLFAHSLPGDISYISIIGTGLELLFFPGQMGDGIVSSFSQNLGNLPGANSLNHSPTEMFIPPRADCDPLTKLDPLNGGHLSHMCATTDEGIRAALIQHLRPTGGTPDNGTGLMLLPAPSLSAPVNGAGDQSTMPTFIWSTVADASSYRIMVANDANALPRDPTVGTCLACVLDDTTTATSYPFTSTALIPGRTYFWQVHARSPDSFGTWSTRASFSTSSGTTGTFVSGETKFGRILSVGETNSYTFTAGTNDSVMLKLTETEGREQMVEMSLYGPDGSIVFPPSGYRTTAAFDFQATRTGTYRPGTYSVLVRGYNGSGTGPYKLTLVNFPGAVGTDVYRGEIARGQTRTGAIDFGDLNVWTFTAGTNDSVMLKLTETEGREQMVEMSLYGPDGSVVFPPSGYRTTAAFDFQATRTGTYRPGTYSVLVRGYSGSGTGPYKLTLVNFPGAVGTDVYRGEIASGQTRTGAIDFGDLNVWTFTAGTNDSVMLKLTETEGREQMVEMSLYGPDGSVVFPSSGYRTTATFDFQATRTGTYRPGTYSVLVRGYSGSGTGPYKLTLVNFPGAVGTDVYRGEIASGQTRTGAIDFGDLNVWTFTAGTNDSVMLKLTETEGREQMVEMSLYGPDGSVVFPSSGYRTTATFDFQATRTGTYRPGTYSVLVRGYNGSGTGPYKLTLVNFPGAVGTDVYRGEIASGQTRTGAIDFGDLNVWTFTAGTNDSVMLKLTETEGREQMVEMSLYGPDGSVVFPSSGYHTTATFDFQATRTGTYRPGTYSVLVRGYNGSGTGPYKLTLVNFPGAVGTDVYRGEIASGQTRTGAIDFGDLNVWTFTAGTNDSVMLKLTETEGREQMVEMSLYGPDGSVVFPSSGYRTTAAFDFQASRTGTYRPGTYSVLVRGYNGSGTGPYKLTLVKFPGAVGTDVYRGEIASGQTRTGAIDFGDLNVWTFTAGTKAV